MRQPQPCHTSAGFSVVELLVALTLELILVAGVTLLTSNTGQSYRSASGTWQQVESGRFGMDTFRLDLQLAGFFGMLSPSPASGWSAPGSLPDPCDTTAGTILGSLATGLAVPVTGYDNVTTSPLACITGGIASGTDILVIRRADTNTTALASLATGMVYLQAGVNDQGIIGYVLGTCTSASSCAGKSGQSNGTAPVDVSGTPAAVFKLGMRDGTVAPIRRLHLHIYYIRPWSGSSSESPQVPTLVRLVLGSGGTAPALATEPLIEGIENLQIQYGVDGGIDGATGVANDGTPDQYVGAGSLAAGAWFDVVAVKMSLLARSLEQETNYTDAKVYNLAGQQNLKPGGHYRRHAFVNVVKLLNVGTRRECRELDLPPECL